MVPSEFVNFFIASTGAAAALAGLLFVAVSLAPERIVTLQAPVERQAVAGSAFTALITAFFLSIAALIPHFNLGTFVVPFSCVSLLTTLFQAWALLRPFKSWPSFLRRAIMVLLSLFLYGSALWQGVGLITNPNQVGFVYGVLSVLMGCFGLGLIRAWELLGARRYGLSGWLNPIRDVDERESFSRADNADAASRLLPADDGVPRSQPQ